MTFFNIKRYRLYRGLVFVLAGITLLFSFVAHALDDEEFDEGNRLLSVGDFKAAEALYRAAVEKKELGSVSIKKFAKHDR